MTRSRGIAVASATTVLALLLFVVNGSVANASPDVVYDALGPTVPSNVQSLGFAATQTAEFGDLVQLAPGPRELATVSVMMSSQACETGGGVTCVTATGATFTHPLTMTLYNAVDPLGTPTVGSVIATVTTTFTIPFRPSADPVNCTGGNAGRWFNGTTCFSGVAHVVDFSFPAGTVLPDVLIWGISYNTSTGGYAPIGTPGPWDSLNVGALTVNPTIGTDLNEDMAFTAAGIPPGPFASELEFTGARPMARIETVPDAAPPLPTTTTTTTQSVTTTTAGAVSPASGSLPATGSGHTVTLALVGVFGIVVGTTAFLAAPSPKRPTA